MDCTWTILQARILEWVAFPFAKGPSQPGIEPRSPALQVDSLPAEPQGKPKNTEVSSLSLLQPTQGSSQPRDQTSLLHCRQILYQLNYQGSPEIPPLFVWDFVTFHFILEYSQLTMLWQFPVDSKGTQPYTCMFPFSLKLFCHPGCHITLNKVPCAIH